MLNRQEMLKYCVWQNNTGGYLELVLERDKKRYGMLRAIYITANGDISQIVDFEKTAADEGLSEADSKDVLSYLQEENLIVYIPPFHPPVVGSYTSRLKNNHPELPVPWNLRHLYEREPVRPLPKRAPMSEPKVEVKLTHKGRKEVEQSIMNPDKSTEHFTPSIIQHFNAPVGAVQNAAHSTANVNQNFETTIPEVLSLVRELRHALQSLPAESQQTTTHMIDVIEAEVQSDERDIPKIKSLMNGVKTLAIAASTGVAVVSTVEKVVELADKIVGLLS